MSRERINLTVLVVIAGESLQRNLLPGELRHGDLSRLLWSLWGELLGLLRLELTGLLELLRLDLLRLKLARLPLLKLTALLELLRLKLPRLLWLKLAALLELLGILSKLLVLLELSLELVWLLLLLLEVPEVLVEIAGV